MYQSIQLMNTTRSVKNFLHRSDFLRRPSWQRGFLLIALALASFALSPTARAVDPPPDGGYPNGNTAEGEDALFNLTTGLDNTAIGFHALLRNTSGSENTATGSAALANNTTGAANTAVGFDALLSNTTGGGNTAVGQNALFRNTTGFGNIAIGFNSLFGNTTGNNNMAIGNYAISSNTTGTNNTIIGVEALFVNTTGSNNTANGAFALFGNTTGSDNTAHGLDALLNNTTGSFNTADGVNTLLANTTGSNNTAVGVSALDANSGNSNIALGVLAGANLTTGSNNIDIGNVGLVGESNTIRIGTNQTHKNTFIAGIRSGTIPAGIPVIIGPQGRLGTTMSSERFKDSIKPMDKTSEAILALKPVTFRYKHELDPDGIPQFGLVAEQVEKVNPDLVARDEQGKPYTVRYEAVNAMLLNEFLKEHRKVEEQEATIAKLESADAKKEITIAQQQKEIQALTSAVKEQAAKVQKISDALEMAKPVARIVTNN